MRTDVGSTVRTVIVSILLGLLVVACGGGDDVSAPAGDPTFPGSDDPELVEHAETAVADLVDRIGATEEDITIVRAERVTWDSGALGCPQEGQFYTQALVDGYRIVLEADGEEYAYHGELDEPPFYCAEPAEEG